METEVSDYDAAPLGLYNEENEILPLFSTEIKAVIYDQFSRVKLIQTYYNPYDQYLDTSYKFPKGLYQAFDGIEAEIDGKKIKGLVGLKKNIQFKYVSNLSKGSTVVSMEELCPTSAKVSYDILITKIGNISPKKQIKITFSFIQPLDKSVGKKMKFVLPLVLTPKYTPLEKTFDLIKDFVFQKKDKYENYQNLNSMLKSGKIKYIKNENGNDLQYYYNININLHSTSKIEKI